MSIGRAQAPASAAATKGFPIRRSSIVNCLPGSSRRAGLHGADPVGWVAKIGPGPCSNEPYSLEPSDLDLLSARRPSFPTSAEHCRAALETRVVPAAPAIVEAGFWSTAAGFEEEGAWLPKSLAPKSVVFRAGRCFSMSSSKLEGDLYASTIRSRSLRVGGRSGCLSPRSSSALNVGSSRCGPFSL